jgi:hypothetical protein
MKFLNIYLFFLFPFITSAQQWVDTVYQIQTFYDIPYGTSIDFAGTSRVLEMDISVPVGDMPPDCGRPLMLLVHGGAWIWGHKGEGNVKRLREDFAKRGYTTASVNYRLGMFHTNQFVNCNVPNWNCFNMTDTAEWYRANHRAVQDVNGAIRFLVNNANQYHINPDNIFIAGESAGAFIAMGVGFIDDDTEVLHNLTGSLPDAPAPNALYESPCIQGLGLANSIQDMDLSRPDLGSYSGFMNFPAAVPYRIKGVGNFYGAVFHQIFNNHSAEQMPALYMFHQPCDLIVHHDEKKIFTGYQNCLMGFPANCGYIVNRPLAFGSSSIKSFIDEMVLNGIEAPEYYLDFTQNDYNCIQQLDQFMSCHAIDNYWLRTTNMAVFFAERVDSCSSSGIQESGIFHSFFNIYPNPASDFVTVKSGLLLPDIAISILDLSGKTLWTSSYKEFKQTIIELAKFHSGIYFIRISDEQSSCQMKLMIMKRDLDKLKIQ